MGGIYESGYCAKRLSLFLELWSSIWEPFELFTSKRKFSQVPKLQAKSKYVIKMLQLSFGGPLGAGDKKWYIETKTSSVHKMLRVQLLLLLLLRQDFPPLRQSQICGFMGLWICGFVDLRICGFVGLWMCEFVDLWICGAKKNFLKNFPRKNFPQKNSQKSFSQKNVQDK